MLQNIDYRYKCEQAYLVNRDSEFDELKSVQCCELAKKVSLGAADLPVKVQAV